MASLKEIMNVDDDATAGPGVLGGNVEPSSAPASSGAPGSSAPYYTAPSYTSPTTPGLPAAGHVLRQPPPPDYPQSRMLARRTSPPPPLALGEDGRHRAGSAGSDQLDALHHSRGASHAHGHIGPALSRSPRQHAPSASIGADHAPKLTPVTGRVSRAKKGVPVHICELCRPPKTFTRAEHLRRHQLSHQPPELACSIPGCDKVFHRKDLLERHQARHEQEVRGQAEAMTPHSSGSTPNDPGPPPPYMAGLHSSHGFALGSAPPEGPRAGGEMGHGMHAADANVRPESWSSTNHGHDRSGRNPTLHPGRDDARGYRMDAMYGGASHDPVSHVCMASHRAPSWQDTEYTHAREQSKFVTTVLHSHAPRLGLKHGAMLPRVDGGSGGTMQSGYNDGGIINLVPTQPILPALRTASQATGRQAHVGDALSLAPFATSVPGGLSHEARSAIPVYLDVFWGKIHSIFPTIHQATFDDVAYAPAEHVEMLQCAMAATATQFLGDGRHRVNGHELYTYARNGSEELTRSEHWPLHVMQTVLLLEYYARFRGRQKEWHLPSSRFHRVYQMAIDHQTTFAQPPGSHGTEATWRWWADVEARRRLLAGCFLLDVHSMMYYAQPAVAMRNLDYTSPLTLPIPLTGATTRLWEAPDARTWDRLMRTTDPAEAAQTVQAALSGPITAGDIARMPAMDAAILLCAWALQLGRRRSPRRAEAGGGTELAGPAARMVSLFPGSGAANAYVALHHAPLHAVLAASGDGWALGGKAPQSATWPEHKRELDEWCLSDQAVVAVTMAARALKVFLSLDDEEGGGEGGGGGGGGPPWREMSDFWGAYVCALICWAYGRGRRCREGGSTGGSAGGSSGGGASRSRRAGLRWIREVAGMEPAQVKRWDGASDTLAVVCAVRDVVARDSVGGRSELLAGAVGVLRRLGEGSG